MCTMPAECTGSVFLVRSSPLIQAVLVVDPHKLSLKLGGVQEP
jgi:hypothetical protein